MMKKSRIFLFAALLLVLALVLTAVILSNRKTAKTPEDMIPLLRKELGLTDEDAALSFAGEYTAEENALLWFSMRGGYSVSYWAAECQLLKNGGYIKVDENGYITLLEPGREVAEIIYERHTLLTQYLTRLGVSPEVAAEDACKLEHVISDESFQAIKRHAHLGVEK